MSQYPILQTKLYVPPVRTESVSRPEQLTEVRVTDLRFTPAEAAEFLNRVMGLNISVDDIAALGTRTEGWTAGLQLAALSMQGQADTASFIQAFTGSHRFVLDYLVEEVLQRQPKTTASRVLNYPFASLLARRIEPSTLPAV